MSTPSAEKPTSEAPLRPVFRWLPRGSHVILALLIVALGLWGHRETLAFRPPADLVETPIRGYGMMGFDAYMQVIAARILTPQDFLATFTEVLTDGRIEAQFYRPVQNLLIAVDYALWGIEPWGYHLTSLIVFGLTILALYAASARMLGPQALIGPVVAALYFGLHPVILNVLPSPARRSDLLVILFLLLILYVLPLGNRRRPWLRLMAAGFLTLLAAGAKDIGVMALGLVFLHQFFFRFEGGVLRSVWRAWLASIPTAVAAGLYMINRTVVLQGFGGYAPREGVPERTYLEKLNDFGGQAVVDVLCPMIFFDTSVLPDRWGALEVGLVALALIVAAALLVAMMLGLSRLTERRRSGVVLILGLAWLIPPTILLGLMNWYGPWYGAIPAAGLGLLLGALTQTGWSLLAGRWYEKVPGLVQLAVVLAVAALPMRYTPLWTHYTEWGRGTVCLQQTLEDLDRQMATAEFGSSLYVKPVAVYEDPPGHRPEHRPRLRWVATMLVKGVQAYAELKYPHKNPKAIYSHQPLARTPANPNQVQIRVRFSEVPTR